MERVISNTFIEDLEGGILRNILKYVKSDTTLAMEIRKNSINIYYRGGSLIKVRESNPNEYKAYFDKNYIASDDRQSVILECIDNITSVEKTKKLVDVIPKIKQQMDFWMHMKKPNGGEREYQHIVAKENNYGNIGKKSDYFICDIEYSGALNENRNFNFDMIGIKWPSKEENRKCTDNLDLCLIDMNYGDDYFDDQTAFLRNINDMYLFLCDENKLKTLKSEMIDVLKIKSRLGLIYPYKEVTVDFSNKIEIIFIFGNHNPENKELLRELNNLKNTEIFKNISKLADIKISISSFMGYGLYENYMLSIDETINLLESKKIRNYK
ncbi:hypothetical protein CHF27_006070 [Romboutsia maritimum]|uniref:Uncharacterized protein n=1 Tax=Romboutsia maritimum TaxID=2020948 RepID=A0A371ITW1_9FIRM|nr:hypothetical protein [Romboutsia maritimum]RDY23916.1 hypothetical protein CHF27_006070 [Romboutsia maritimum]